MPRAYRPRIATSIRAFVAARRLGARSWHLYRPGPHRRGPVTLTLFFGDDRVEMTLEEAEAKAAEVPDNLLTG
jgi:hypothetical protein